MSVAPVGSFSFRLCAGSPGLFEITCDHSRQTSIWEEIEDDGSCRPGEMLIRERETGETVCVEVSP